MAVLQTIVPCGSSSCSPRPSWAECVTGRRRATILPSVTSFAASMNSVAPGALPNAMTGACATCATARVLLGRPTHRKSADKTAAKPRLRLRCCLSSGNTQCRKRSNCDDPRQGNGPRATSTSQPVQSPCPHHHTPAPRCHQARPSRRPPTHAAHGTVRSPGEDPHVVTSDPDRLAPESSPPAASRPRRHRRRSASPRPYEYRYLPEAPEITSLASVAEFLSVSGIRKY
jgi:hypothetical protein